MMMADVINTFMRLDLKMQTKLFMMNFLNFD